jgi:hypothetical protein
MLLSACATVTRGSSDAWEVSTEPSGAKVETSNGRMCESTPCAIRMKRKSEFSATISKPGYKPIHVSVTHKTAGSGAAGVAGNVLVGGLIGLGVDMSTGASQDLVPNPVRVTLEKIEAPAAVAATGSPAPAAAPAPAAPPALAAAPAEAVVKAAEPAAPESAKAPAVAPGAL